MDFPELPTLLADTSPGDAAIVVVVVLARLVIPLFIPQWPLVIIGALVLDAADQTIFQLWTDLDTSESGPYQAYDKALDNYYLAIAYVSTMRNWQNNAAIRVGQFLFLYRLVGATLFELTHWRPILLIFPNTFEYFFIAYEFLRTGTPQGIGALLGALGRRHLGLHQDPAGVVGARRRAGRDRHAQEVPMARADRRGDGRRRALGLLQVDQAATIARRVPVPLRRRRAASAAAARGGAAGSDAEAWQSLQRRSAREDRHRLAARHRLRADPAGRRHDPHRDHRRRGRARRAEHGS